MNTTLYYDTSNFIADGNRIGNFGGKSDIFQNLRFSCQNFQISPRYRLIDTSALAILQISKLYHMFLKIVKVLIKSGSAGESHPHAPTDPCVNLSIHTAPASHFLETSQSQAYAERNPVPPGYPVDLHLPRAGSSPSLQSHYRAFDTNTG